MTVAIHGLVLAWFALRVLASSKSDVFFEVRDDLHFPLAARATNKDGSSPVYKNPHASIEHRVNDLLPRMTLEEKVAQLYVTDPRALSFVVILTMSFMSRAL